MKTRLISLRNVAAALVSAGVLALAGCGGGSSSTTAGSSSAAAPITLTGTAAGGAAIAGGTVNAKCATGSGTATTAADGTYTLTLTGIAPCMLQVTDPVNPANVYYSAVQAGTTTANITPLTSLVVANALGADPATAYTSFSSATQSNITTSTLATAVTNVTAALNGVGVTIPAGTNPLTAAFTAGSETKAGSALDQQIDTLALNLANANVSLSTLVTTVATNSTSAGAVTTAVSTLANNSGISTSSLGGTATAGTTAPASCPYATSGNYLIASVGDNAIQQLSINFSTLTGTNVTKGNSFTITAGVDPNNPCAYTITAPSQTFNVRASQSGLIAFSAAALPTTAATALSASGVGLGVPAPKTAYAVADFQGTWNTASFDQATGASFWGNNFGQLVIDNAGNISHYVCAGGTSCSTTADSTATITGPDASGVFTFTVSDGSVRKFAVYRSVNGDMVAFGVLTSSTSLASQYFVASKRVSAPIVRTVGSSYSLINWQVTNNSTSGLVQTATPKTFTVTAVTSNPYTFTRYDGTDTTNVDTVDVNVPRAGMLTRPAVAATATLPAKALWVAVNGIGWTVNGATTSGAPSSTNPVFFGISIQTPNQ